MKRWLPVSILLAGFVAASALAAERPSLRDAPDLTAIRALIKAEKFTDAIAELDKMVAFGADHADIYNLLGFSHRKSGDLAKAALNYDKALKLDSDHISALEYQGEMFVMMRDMDRARKNLARLVQLCPAGCEERDDLQQAIAGRQRGIRTVVQCADHAEHLNAAAGFDVDEARDRGGQRGRVPEVAALAQRARLGGAAALGDGAVHQRRLQIVGPDEGGYATIVEAAIDKLGLREQVQVLP